MAGRRGGGRCSMVLTYKVASLESFFTDEMAEAASKLDLNKTFKLAMNAFLSAPDKVLELDSLLHQVAASAVLSQHELAKVHVKGETAEHTKPARLQPLEILKAVYARPREGYIELRSMVSADVWRALESVASLRPLTPEEGLEILRNPGRALEVVNLLKVKGKVF
ncbi:MAG: hypothetical protein QW796_05725 [Thermoproteota archaeon]